LEPALAGDPTINGKQGGSFLPKGDGREVQAIN